MEIAQPRVCQLHVRTYRPDFDIYSGLVLFPEEDRLNGQGLTVGELYDFLEKEVLRGDWSDRPAFQIYVYRLPFFDEGPDTDRPEEPLPSFMSEGFRDFVVEMVREWQPWHT